MKKLAEILNYYNYEKLSEYHKYENDFVNNIITSIIDNVKTNTESGLYNVIIDEDYDRKTVETFHDKMPISYEHYQNDELISGVFNYYIADDRKFSVYITNGHKILLFTDSENHVLNKWECK